MWASTVFIVIAQSFYDPLDIAADERAVVLENGIDFFHRLSQNIMFWSINVQQVAMKHGKK